MSTPINMHSANMLGALFSGLHPDGSITQTFDGWELRVPGFVEYLLVTSEVIYGPGVGWRVRAMGPSEWVVGDFDVVQRYSVESVETFKASVRHTFRSCGDETPEPSADAVESLDCSDALKNLITQALRFAHPMAHDDERTAVMSLSTSARVAHAELYPEDK